VRSLALQPSEPTRPPWFGTGVTQRIVRDARGRLVGLEGPSRVDALQAAIDQLEDHLLAAEGWARLPDLKLMLNTKNLGALCTRFEVMGLPRMVLRWTRDGRL
jgi:hypothetical protein